MPDIWPSIWPSIWRARPAPLVEFGLIGLAKVELHIGALQSQQEPPLLLSNADRALIAANVTGGKPVPQPAGGTSDKFDVGTRHSDLLVELAQRGLLELLSETHTALGKLPTATAGAAAEKHLTLATHQDDADVRAKAV